jgi:YD repeat-containing protein
VTAVAQYAYDNANRRSTLTLPNGVVTEYGYDAASQLTGLTYKLGGTTLGCSRTRTTRRGGAG